MKKILLTKGASALVDNEDFEMLNEHKWYLSFYGYAVRDIGGRKYKVAVPMHRFLNKTPRGYVTDHINRNKLDNRKANLRSVTGSQNGINRGLNKNNTSGYKGVYWRKDVGRWAARLKVNYKNIYLGNYNKLNDAIAARKKGEGLYHQI